MNVTSKLLLFVVAATVLLGAGYAAGRYFADPVVEVLPVSEQTATVTVRDGSDAVALAKALSEVAALKTENAALRKDLEATHRTPEAMQQTESPQRHQNWRDRMEEMKTNDPERYKKEMARREQFFQAMTQARNERATFLDSVDPSLLSAEGRATHARFIEAFNRSAEIEGRIRTAFEAGEQPSEALVAEAREVMQTLHETRSAERVALLDAIATSMGLSETDAEDFRKLVDDVYDATGHGGPRRMPPVQMTPAPPAGNH